MIANIDQITLIIKTNPNKNRIVKGREINDKLMLHLYGKGLKESIKYCEQFVSVELHKVQKDYATSNKDMYGRLLQQEDLIFTARGGGQYFGMEQKNEYLMNELLSDVRYDQSLRTWIRNFALPAYRSDPMGVIFMETEAVEPAEQSEAQEPNTYPTYKNIYSIFDYETEGRELEYICFNLTIADCLGFGIADDDFKDQDKGKKTQYYRFVDDRFDSIYKFKTDTNSLQEIDIKEHGFNETPGFIISDRIRFDDPTLFESPLDMTVELADTFLYNRSVRDLQQKYHGFAKAIEPLLKCSTCAGTGLLASKPCPACTEAGQTKGTGFKLKTKVSDVARFPIDLFAAGSSFDYTKIFGYVTPDIKGWEKQDQSLNDLEELVEMTYWGTVRMRRPAAGSAPGADKTATEIDSNNTPKYARLNMTADWAERTEKMIADFIGQYWFAESYKSASISYGRNYVLETPEDIMANYQVMRAKGAPDFTLDEQLGKYYNALYQNNPFQLEKSLKLLKVEPFPHINTLQAKGVIPDENDFNAKLYFGEWYSQMDEVYLVSTPAETLRQDLKAWVLAKKIPPQIVPETATLRVT